MFSHPTGNRTHGNGNGGIASKVQFVLTPSLALRSCSAVSVLHKVMVVGYDPNMPLPRAATCFFTLKLPRYPDLYSLRKYLLVAIRHGSSGFEFS